MDLAGVISGFVKPNYPIGLDFTFFWNKNLFFLVNNL